MKTLMGRDRPFWKVLFARRRAIAFKHWAEVPESCIQRLKLVRLGGFPAVQTPFFSIAEAVEVFLV